MKFTFARSACFGVALTLAGSIGSSQAQLAGQTTGTGTGFGSTASGGTSTKLPGSFGGPGVTGQSRLELSGTNPSTAFSNGQSVSGTSSSGTTGGTGGLAGQTTSGNQFGTNAFSNSGQTGANGFGGLNNGLGGAFGGNRFGGGLGGLGGFGGLGGGGTGSTSANAKKMIRPIIRPDVEIERESNSEIAKSAKNRLARIQMPKRLKSVDASIEGETIVLRGQVATESDKRMVERLVMLEPGIDSVRNEVTVKTSPAERIQAKPTR